MNSRPRTTLREPRAVVTLECRRCNITWTTITQPPPVCPNCRRPWGDAPPIEHREAGGTQHELGYVAWCSCGVGTPPKESVDIARRSLAAHVANPKDLPR